ncbi:lycopene beta-cyclase [Kushneria sinocarnis]|uniref:Lycopene beta-cyclase n=1 Tax=Kushneria sinocarnis TaxID=595502 RepID=A0A420WVH2_9GAMM|nr:lycopene cyclase family protein [Kushneria sinocarnis]RKR02553.1 lycopene beta-cyclase [Kushneria sinocarnis]
MNGPHPDSNPRVPLLILGGGCAGLSLAYRLACSPAPPRTIIIEPRHEHSDDRTWCGWALTPHPFSDLVTARWESWWIHTAQGSQHVTGSPWPYEMLNSAAFHERTLSAIEAHPDIALWRGHRVVAIEDHADGVQVRLADGQQLQARHVVDTLPRPERLGTPWAWQDFAGLEIEAGGIDATQPPDLMDFRVATPEQLDFIYRLPHAPGRALFEWTRFGRPASDPHALRASLIAHLEAQFPGGYRIVREEMGSLPMAPPTAVSHGARVVAGAYAGSMRAATGYAFHAIQRWADECSEALLKGDPPRAPRRQPWLERLDRIYMRAIEHHPGKAPEFYRQLFARAPAASVVRFLAGAPRWRDTLNIMRSLPPGPFLQAALRG